MKRAAILFFGVSVALLAGCAALSRNALPERIATHFDGRGAPDGWMNATPFLWSYLGLGLVASLATIGMVYGARFLPARFLNVPHAAFWRRPENHRRACGHLFTASLWFGSGLLLWMAAVLRLVVTANQSSPPHLNGSHLIIATAAFFAFTLAWTAALLLIFFKAGNAAPPSA